MHDLLCIELNLLNTSMSEHQAFIAEAPDFAKFCVKTTYKLTFNSADTVKWIERSKDQEIPNVKIVLDGGEKEYLWENVKVIYNIYP